MKLIEEIIDLLSSGESNLTTALFKTKVLLHKLGEVDSLEWVNSELKGFPNADSLPNYRILDVNLRANASNSVYRYQAQPLPVMHLAEHIRDRLCVTKLTQSIAVLEEYSQQEDLQIVIPPEYFPSLSKGFGNGFQIENAWGEHSAGAMTQVLTEVTSRLLDFVLELSEQFPNELNTTELKEKSKEIGVSDIFNNAVFGDNATIVVGDSNEQNIKNSVIKNDLASLNTLLSNNDVSEEEIQELNLAIQADEGDSNLIKQSFGKNVSSWMGKMITKSASAAWKIKTGAAASLLATAIGKYYGFT